MKLKRKKKRNQMRRIIVVEGCDRTGKSTFISKLDLKLRDKGYFPVIFHLMGPTKFDSLKFDNDDKSLIQLAKFNDEYDLFREILNANSRNIIILDRSHFGEYVWTRYWNRVGKYTNYLFSEEFFNRHKDLFDNMLYINFFMSDINKLADRINSFEEDKRIFTENGKSVLENISDVYKMFNELLDIVKEHQIKNISLDNNSTIEYLDILVKNTFNQL